MSHSFSPWIGQGFDQVHRDRAAIATKIRAFLGLGLYISVYAIRFEVWHRVIWVHVPGFRPRFLSRTAIGV